MFLICVDVETLEQGHVPMQSKEQKVLCDKLMTKKSCSQAEVA